MADSKQPNIPVCSEVLSNSVTLTWNMPQGSPDDIKYYRVKYRIQKKTNKWSSVDTKDNLNSYCVEGLESEVTYEFRVQAVFDDEEEGLLSKPCQNIVTQKSVVKDILVGAKKLTNGKPAIYKLPMATSNESVNLKAKTRRCIFGNRPQGSFKEKTVMVVGGTGAGKSTLIDAVINHIMGVEWEHDFRVSIIDLAEEEIENSKDKSKSQTEWITCYTICPQEGTKHDYTLNIVDTPGFGDTGGIVRDRAIVDHLRELFNSSGNQGIEILDAVWFVVKASDARLTPSQQYIYQSILSIFGKDIEKNIFMILTFVDSNQLPVMQALKEAQVPCENVFTFNNVPQCVIQDDPLVKSCGPVYWQTGKDSFNKLFDTLMKTQQTSLKLTAEVLTTRRKLETTIKGVQSQIKVGLQVMDTIRQKKMILKMHEKNMSDNTLFEYNVTEIHQKKKDLKPGTYVTNCLVCNVTCHYPCGIPDDKNKKNCSAMENGKCTVCPKKCDWNHHVNNSYRFKCFPVTVSKTSEDLKLELSTKVQDMSDIVKKLDDEFYAISSNVSSMIDYVRGYVNRLKQIALKEDPLSSVDYINILIQSEKDHHKAGFLERIKMLEAIKEQTQLLQTIPDTKFNPWKDLENDI